VKAVENIADVFGERKVPLTSRWAINNYLIK
jgi:hypothetical protein